jgi:RNA polymerase sigma-70 factor, ECF subfamily
VPEAFAQLHAIYSRRLFRTILRITKSREDAEDALQDTFLRAHLAFETFEGRSSIYSWLTRIAVNSALMILRKRRTHPEELFNPQPNDRSKTFSFEVRDSRPNPEEACDLRERQLRILRAICRLDPILRPPLRMQVIHGWSVSEISRALNISKAAVKSRLYRGRKSLSATCAGQHSRGARARPRSQHEQGVTQCWRLPTSATGVNDQARGMKGGTQMSLKTDLHAFRSGPGAKLVSDLARDGGLSI